MFELIDLFLTSQYPGILLFAEIASGPSTVQPAVCLSLASPTDRALKANVNTTQSASGFKLVNDNATCD